MYSRLVFTDRLRWDEKHLRAFISTYNKSEIWLAGDTFIGWSRRLVHRYQVVVYWRLLYLQLVSYTSVELQSRCVYTIWLSYLASKFSIHLSSTPFNSPMKNEYVKSWSFQFLSYDGREQVIWKGRYQQVLISVNDH